MRHLRLFEIHDHPWCPAVLRDLFTDSLQAIWIRLDGYRSVVPLLRRTMEDAGIKHVVDLCSGAGGPWLQLAHDFEQQDYAITVLLTDIHPNIEGLQQVCAESKYLSFHQQPVSALQVPADLHGFRTIFSTFHHFSPNQAHRILSDAATHGEGIAIFEGASRDIRVMLAICFLPFLALLTTPAIRPFRWSRVIWTYVIPVVPFMLWFDGIMSCLRAYSKDELFQISDQTRAEDYHWQAETKREGLIRITYLIGYPRRADRTHSGPEDSESTETR